MMDAIERTILAALILSSVMRNMNDMIPNSNLSNSLPVYAPLAMREVVELVELVAKLKRTSSLARPF
jgi:hypothetical protein